MLWVLWDILIPVLLAFFAGLFIGWLLWRWRRRAYSSESIHSMRRDNASYRSEIKQLRARISQSPAERTRLSGKAFKVDSRDTGQLEKRSASVAAEKSRDIRNRAHNAPVSVSPQERGSEAPANTVDMPESSSVITRLQDTIAVRDKMITTLQRSLDQYVDQNELTALSAELAMRERKIDALETLLEQQRRH